MYGIHISRSVEARKIEVVTGKSEGKLKKVGSMHTQLSFSSTSQQLLSTQPSTHLNDIHRAWFQRRTV